MDINKVIDDLVSSQYAHVKSGFHIPDLLAFDNYVALLNNENKFNKAGISNESVVIDAIRKDEIIWLNSSDEKLQWFSTILTSLKEALNSTLFVGINDFEFFLAQYPIGSYYKKHLDQFEKDDNRLFTFIFYLNKDCKPEDGGQLKMYLQDGTIKIEPEYGDFILFKSIQFHMKF